MFHWILIQSITLLKESPVEEAEDMAMQRTEAAEELAGSTGSRIFRSIQRDGLLFRTLVA